MKFFSSFSLLPATAVSLNVLREGAGSGSRLDSKQQLSLEQQALTESETALNKQLFAIEDIFHMLGLSSKSSENTEKNDSEATELGEPTDRHAFGETEYPEYPEYPSMEYEAVPEYESRVEYEDEYENEYDDEYDEEYHKMVSEYDDFLSQYDDIPDDEYDDESNEYDSNAPVVLSEGPKIMLKGVLEAAHVPTAQMPMMLVFLSDMYDRLKANIAAATRQEEKSKAHFKKENEDWEKKPEKWKKDPAMIRIHEYWQTQRQNSHRHFKAVLNMSHGSMKRIKWTMDLMEKAVAGEKPSKEEMAKLEAMAGGSVQNDFLVFVQRAVALSPPL